MQHGPDLPDIGPFETEIGKQDNQRSHRRLSTGQKSQAFSAASATVQQFSNLLSRKIFA